jgi:hypothetical protein
MTEANESANEAGAVHASQYHLRERVGHAFAALRRQITHPLPQVVLTCVHG